MGYVYILKSLSNDSYYVGSTDDINRRWMEHKLKKVLSTKSLLPLKLVFKQKFKDLKKARLAEIKIKRWKRRDFIEKVIKNQKLEFRKGGPDTR